MAQAGNQLFKMTYPGKEAYTFTTTPQHESPCMSQYWRAIQNERDMKGYAIRDEIEHEEKEDDEETK